MSHTTKINSVPIKDISALNAAVDELKSLGINCELVEKQQPRMYYNNQGGVCDFVLKLHDTKYDVGFQKDETDGTYKIIYDDYMGYVKGKLGAACPLPNTQEERLQHSVGKLMQLYSKHATINAATLQGYLVESCYEDEHHNLQLVIGGIH
jgi:hypothetical protein